MPDKMVLMKNLCISYSQIMLFIDYTMLKRRVQLIRGHVSFKRTKLKFMCAIYWVIDQLYDTIYEYLLLADS